MKTLEEAIEEFSYLKTEVVKEVITYDCGEEVDRTKEYEDGSVSISLIGNEKEDIDYTLCVIGLSAIKEIDTTEDQLYVRTWYNMLVESGCPIYALGKATLEHDIYRKLKNAMDSEENKDECSKP